MSAAVAVTEKAPTPATADPSTPPAAALDFDGVGMTFPDGTTALDSVDLTVAAGELVSIVGPSGCGKSTLLRIASGLLAPTAGALLVPENVGYVFQDATLMPWRTVRRNVSLFAEFHDIARDRRRALVDEAIRLVGLEGFENAYPRRLSGGMRMRVSLARSLLLRPPAFLFDEPFGALDEITRERLNDELLSLRARQGFAGLFVTHSVPEAVFLSDRVVVMSPRPGRLVHEVEVDLGPVRRPEVRHEPRFAELSHEVSDALREAMA